jgi:hypothetical protein
LAYNLIDTSDLNIISYYVSWWYNWHFLTDAPKSFTQTYSMNFVPMLWKYNSEAGFEEITQWLIEHPDVDDVLVMNELNLVDQANMPPTDAVEHWKYYEQLQADMPSLYDRNTRLIAPVLTWTQCKTTKIRSFGWM